MTGQPRISNRGMDTAMIIVVMYTGTWGVVWDDVTGSVECCWPWCTVWLGCHCACHV